MARVARLIALIALTGTASAAVVTIKQTFAAPDCTGAPMAAVTTPGAACAAGVTKVPICTAGADGSSSEACFEKTAFASPWTSLVPATLLGEAGADLTFVPDDCAKVGSVTVSASGGNCVANGTDVAAVYCEGPKLYSVSFAAATECAAAPGVKLASTPITCAAAGKPSGFCLNAAVPAGCKSDFVAVNPTVGAMSCFGGGPGGKTAAPKALALPVEVPGVAAEPAADAPAAAAPAAEPAKSSAAAAAASGAAMAAVALALLMA